MSMKAKPFVFMDIFLCIFGSTLVKCAPLYVTPQIHRLSR